MASKVLDIEIRGRDNGTVAMLNATASASDVVRDRLQRMGLVADPKVDGSLKVLQRYQADISAIQAKAAADRLRAEGRELEAEVTLTRQAAEAKKRAVDISLNQQLRRAPAGGDYADRLRASAEAKKGAIDDAATTKITALQQQAARERADMLRAEAASERADEDRRLQERVRGEQDQLQVVQRMEAETTAAHTRAQAERLRADGRNLEAELLLLERGAEAQRQAVQRSLTQQMSRNPSTADGDRLRAAAASQLSAIDAEAQARGLSLAEKAHRDTLARELKDAENAAAEQRRLDEETARNAERAAQRSAEVKKTLRGAELESVRARADGGDAAAAAQLRAMQAADRHAATAERLLAVMRDQAATLEQQRTAEQQLLTVEQQRVVAERAATPQAAQLEAFRQRVQREGLAGRRGGIGRFFAAGGGDDVDGDGRADDGGGRQASGGFARVRQMLGRRSTIGQIGGLLRGTAGPTAGLTMAVGAVGQMAEKLATVNAEFAGGQMSSKMYFMEFAKGMPFIGQFVEAGQQIRTAIDSFTEEGKARALAAGNVKAGEAFDEYRRNLRVESRTSARRTAAEVTSSNDRAADAGLVGEDAEQAHRNEAMASRRRESAQKREDDQRAAKEEHDARVKQIGEASQDAATKGTLLASADREFRERQAQINAEYNRTDAAAERAAEIEDIVARGRHARDVLNLLADMHRQATDLQAKGDADRLRLIGRDFEAELATLRQHAASRKEAVEEAFQKTLRDTAEGERPALQAAHDESEAATVAAEQQQEAGLRYKTLLDAQTRALQMQAAAGDEIAAAALQRFEAGRQLTAELQTQLAIMADMKATPGERARAVANYKGLQAGQQASVDKDVRDAELQSLRDQADAGDRLAAVELKRREEAKALTDQQARLLAIINDQAGAITAAQKAQAAGALGDLQRGQEAAQRDQVQRDLREQRTATLQNRAQFGATGGDRIDARKQLAEGKISEELKERQAQAAAVLSNPKASAAEKAEAAANLQSFGANAAREYGQDVYGSERTRPTFQGEERGLLTTGVAAAARDHAQADPQRDIVRNTADSLKVQSDMLTAIKEFLAKFQPQPASAGSNAQRPLFVRNP